MWGLCLTANFVGNLLPYFFKVIADRVLASPGTISFHLLLGPLLFIAGVLILTEILYRSGHIIELYIAPAAFAKITSSLYEGLIQRPVSYFENKFSGDLGRRIEQVGTATFYFIQDFPWGAGWAISSLIAAGVLLGVANIYLLLTFLVWFVLSITTSIPILVRHYRASEAVAKVHAQLSGNIVDAVSNIPLIHSFGGVGYENIFNDRKLSEVMAAERKMRWIFVWNRFQQGVSIIVFGISLTLVSIFLFSHGQFSVGDFVIVAATIPSVIAVAWNMGDIISRTVREVGTMSDAIKNLKENQLQLVGGNLQGSARSGTSIDFRDISFQYPGTSSPVFNNFSFHINEGEKVGIVGPSGTGKSTLVKLLLRQQEVQTGIVAIGGVPVKDFSLTAFNKLISYVPQDTSLFHRTLFENIHYADPAASREAVIEASKQARANEFIQLLPQKYETLVGERGVKLSGGQRQRIALSRAILKNAPILVLDEATSALDSESEGIVQAALGEVFARHTVIAIAHRLSTLRSMDRIVVMEQGAIVESGNPQELLKKDGGIFKEIWEQQKNGFV